VCAYLHFLDTDTPTQVVDDASRAYAERQAKLYEEWHTQVFDKIQVRALGVVVHPAEWHGLHLGHTLNATFTAACLSFILAAPTALHMPP